MNFQWSLGWSWGPNENQKGSEFWPDNSSSPQTFNSPQAAVVCFYKEQIPGYPTWISTHPPGCIHQICQLPAWLPKEHGLYLQFGSSWCQAKKAKSWLSNAHWWGTSKKPTATGALVVEASGDRKTCDLWHQFQHLLCHCAKPSARAERLRIFHRVGFVSGRGRMCWQPKFLSV